MIDPTERRSPLFTTLLPTSLYAVLANVDANGNLPSADSGGTQGGVIFLPDGNCEALGTNLWIVRHGTRHVPEGKTLQIYAPGNHLAKEIGGNAEQNPWFDQYGAPSLVVSAFESGITGADRAMAQAMADELSDIEYMHALDACSNEMLAHALYTDLREHVSLEEHLANIHELEGFADASSGTMGDEIREFLVAMRNPRDKIGRYNVYRKVLIVRAVQRRAKGIVTDKLDRVQEIVAAQNATAMYIGDVERLAGRAASVLTDKQPWWTSNGILPSVDQHMRRKFANRLRGYVASLECIYANPFRPWAALAAYRMNAMVMGLETDRFQDIGSNSDHARGYLQAMRVQERVSRGVMSVRQDGGMSAAHDALAHAIDWSLQTAPRLRISTANVREIVHESQVGQRTGSKARRIEALRNVEWNLMAVGVAHAA